MVQNRMIDASASGASAPSKAVRYVCDLAKKNSEALSFIPLPKLELYAGSGQIMLATENDDPCGFVVHGSNWPQLRIYQACIQYDARRREHGLALVERLVAKGMVTGCQDLRLWCADDLEANSFWGAAGFSPHAQRTGGKRRGRVHTLWARRLRSGLFDDALASHTDSPATGSEHKAFDPKSVALSGEG